MLRGSLRNERAGTERVADARQTFRGDLPFEFGRQSLARPAGEGICLVVADVANRSGEIDGLQTAETHLVPFAIALVPIIRSLPPLAIYGRPAVGKPQRSVRIAVCLHEFEPLAIADEAVGEAEGMDQCLTARRLVVPVEASARMADLVDAAVEGNVGEAGSLVACRKRRRLAIGRPQRALCEQRQDVGEQKLLVLLLVIDADLNEPCHLPGGIDAACEERVQALIDMRAVGENLGIGGPRQERAFRPRLPLALAFVIRIEAEIEFRVENPVARQMMLQDESLEEPGDVRQMPLGRARVLHGLDDLIFRRERSRKTERELASGEEARRLALGGGVLWRTMQLAVDDRHAPLRHACDATTLSMVRFPPVNKTPREW